MVFVISHVLEHGGDKVLGSFCYSPRAHDTQGPEEGVPSTAARVAMEMRAAVKGRRAA